MFSADEIKEDVDVKVIFSKISDFDIFKRYCTNFEEINKSFKSEFYNDNTASCRIYQSKDNVLSYKDFGTDDYCSSIYYVVKKYNCTYKEALNIIATDFGIINSNSKVSPSFILGEYKPKILSVIDKSYITIVPRNWTLYDYNYWVKKYGISLEWLESYEITPCEYVYLHKHNNKIAFPYSNQNPIYAYKINDENGKIGYKIYRPYEKDKRYKWMSDTTSDMIQGYNQLPKTDDLLIITKSLKDVICCRLCGYSAISLQAEGIKLEKNVADKLEIRFKKIILLYDNDVKGYESAKKITKEYGFKSIIIPLNTGCKDLSELIEKSGLEVAKTTLNGLLFE